MATRPSLARAILAALLVATGCLAGRGAVAAGPARAPALPEIRISQTNSVPACVTPERLMRFLGDNNPRLDARYRDIAGLYKRHGEALGIRWDYAFFQMVLETNYLAFRRGNGEPGDVRARQNNFAGLGATGGGVPGESFADISTGVLAQMQHLLAYAGERVEAPVAVRTRENQGDIIAQSRALKRPVRFSDLTNRWAADRSYARSMEVIASRFEEGYCAPALREAQTTTAKDDAAAKAWRGEVALAAPKPVACGVWSASFGGPVALLIRSFADATVNYTILEVETGREQAQADAFIATHAPGGQAISRFASRDQAVARAFELCPKPS